MVLCFDPGSFFPRLVVFVGCHSQLVLEPLPQVEHVNPGLELLAERRKILVFAREGEFLHFRVDGCHLGC